MRMRLNKWTRSDDGYNFLKLNDTHLFSIMPEVKKVSRPNMATLVKEM